MDHHGSQLLETGTVLRVLYTSAYNYTCTTLTPPPMAFHSHCLYFPHHARASVHTHTDTRAHTVHFCASLYTVEHVKPLHNIPQYTRAIYLISPNAHIPPVLPPMHRICPQTY